MKNLVNIQNELKVPKGNFNSFGKYRYRSAEDILEAVKPLLLKYNAVLRLSDDVVSVGDKVFIKSVATISLDNDSLSVQGFAETGEHKGMSSEQQTGCASSYARKYALNGLFLIDETEADADHPKPEQNQRRQTSGVSSTSSADKPPLATIERIRNAEKAIRELGGEVVAFNPTGKLEVEMKAELESLTDQYNRLKANRN